MDTYAVMAVAFSVICRCSSAVIDAVENVRCPTVPRRGGEAGVREIFGRIHSLRRFRPSCRKPPYHRCFAPRGREQTHNSSTGSLIGHRCCRWRSDHWAPATTGSPSFRPNPEKLADTRRNAPLNVDRNILIMCRENIHYMECFGDPRFWLLVNCRAIWRCFLGALWRRRQCPSPPFGR